MQITNFGCDKGHIGNQWGAFPPHAHHRPTPSSVALAASYWLRSPSPPTELVPPSSLQRCHCRDPLPGPHQPGRDVLKTPTRSGRLPPTMPGGGGESWSVGQTTLMTHSLVEGPLLNAGRLKVPHAPPPLVSISSPSITCRKPDPQKKPTRMTSKM